jgi:hypothetical protein
MIPKNTFATCSLKYWGISFPKKVRDFASLNICKLGD